MLKRITRNYDRGRIALIVAYRFSRNSRIQRGTKMITATHLKPPKTPVSLLVPNGDFYHVTEHLTEVERNALKRVRSFMETKGAPVIAEFWSRDCAAASREARQSVIRRPTVIGRRCGRQFASRLTPEPSTRSQRLRSS
jgi:hypothetical protein